MRLAALLAALLAAPLAIADPAPDMAAALAAVVAEPAVVDAAWSNPDPRTPSLLAGVHDDGTRRDGFASYLCLVLGDHAVRGAIVRVMDVATDNWRELGKAVCP